MILEIIGIYILGLIIFPVIDALIGFGVEFDGDDWPPLSLATLGWPIVIPVALIAKFISHLSIYKRKRISREESHRKIRVSLQAEEENFLNQIEQELQEELKKSA